MSPYLKLLTVKIIIYLHIVCPVSYGQLLVLTGPPMIKEGPYGELIHVKDIKLKSFELLDYVKLNRKHGSNYRKIRLKVDSFNLPPIKQKLPIQDLFTRKLMQVYINGHNKRSD
jgi:hypothetical protein